MDHAPDVEEMLAQRIEVGPGEWKLLGDCSGDDLEAARIHADGRIGEVTEILAALEGRRAQVRAQALLAEAERP